jgi:hypothetical protein
MDEFYIDDDFIRYQHDSVYKGKSYRSAIVNADSYAKLVLAIYGGLHHRKPKRDK